MIKADKVCDICGKKRGRPYDHTLCAIKRKAKHAAVKSKRHKSAESIYTDANITGYTKMIEGTYYD